MMSEQNAVHTHVRCVAKLFSSTPLTRRLNHTHPARPLTAQTQEPGPYSCDARKNLPPGQGHVGSQASKLLGSPTNAMPPQSSNPSGSLHFAAPTHAPPDSPSSTRLRHFLARATRHLVRVVRVSAPSNFSAHAHFPSFHPRTRTAPGPAGDPTEKTAAIAFFATPAGATTAGAAAAAPVTAPGRRVVVA